MYHYLPVELGLFYAYIANEFICHCLFQIAHLLSAAFFTATENIYFVLKRNTHNSPFTLNSQEIFSILPIPEQNYLCWLIYSFGDIPYFSRKELEK